MASTRSSLRLADADAAIWLTERTMAAMRQSFAGFGHFPSDAQWAALTAAVRVMADMASGIAEPKAYLSAIDPGVGKTEAVIHFARELLASPDHRDVGALICIGRIEQIKAIASDPRLPPADCAVFTTDVEANAHGRGYDHRHTARVLFTTHEMLERRLAGHGSLHAARDLLYRGEPRAVRVWDEAMLPAKPLTLSRRDIPLLVRNLARDYPGFANELEDFADSLKGQQNGSRLEVPGLGAVHGVGREEIIRAMRGRMEDEVIASTLWHLLGRVVTARQDGYLGSTILDYQEILSDDVWPVLILDASGRVRPLYRLWEERRGGLIRLPAGAKSYRGHIVHIWKTAGSKNAWRRYDKAGRLVNGIVATIQERLDEKWLLVTHRPDSINQYSVEREVRRLLPSTANVSFTTWGRHDATNEFADVPNVILAGTLFFRQSLLEGHGRGAAAHPSSAGAFAKRDIDAVEIGEHQNVILQAMCRGAVRWCKDGGCPDNTHTYIIASERSQIADTITNILPDAELVEWQPNSAEVRETKASRVLRAIGVECATIQDIVERSGVKLTTLKPLLSRLCKAGLIERAARGVYRGLS
jgi:hypothetical protein